MSKTGSSDSSPLMDQYRRIKREHQNEVLFFRVGDFYEMFYEDALEISALLNLTLTNRQGQPMCGIPYHASRSYIARLLRAGKKIAVCEQITEPGNGLIERQVVELITPGTTVDEDFLDKGSSNYLACLAACSKHFSFAYIDISAGDFYACSFPAERAAERFRQELERIQPNEIIVQESLLNEYAALAQAVEERGGLVNRWADWLFDAARSRERLERQFGEECLKGFGLKDGSPEIVSSGALLDYLDDTARSLIPHVRFLKVYGEGEFVGLDESTQRNLELVRNLLDGGSRFSLIEVMDETKTAMGRRLLRGRILHPLMNEEAINHRLDMVEALYRGQEKLRKLRELLTKTPDLERLCSRLAMDKAHGKDMVAVKNALFFFARIEEELGSQGFCDKNPEGFYFESPEAASLSNEDCGNLEALRELLDRGIAEDPSIVLSDGNLIRDGFNEELDRLRELRDSGRKLLEGYLEEEKQATGIQGLKIKYNRFIGYFLEVGNNNLSRVPPRFIRRQGIAGGERFTTDRLAALESEINGASDKIVELEKRLFLELRDGAKKLLLELAAAGKRIAEIDTAQSLARAATVRGWTRPVIDRRNRTLITEGRHPVVEAHLSRGEFIPNDLLLDAGEDESADGKPGISFALITGPNMAGKSTYLRQAALITLMAQSGSFVPASEAYIGLVDRIFCRVGSQDNLARGESTFLVEMNETAYILHSATERSFVIMDEVGRGTGTEDGLSIAWAVCEELFENIRCRTLFATHYHELAKISSPRMANRSMDVAQRDGEIVFLRKLKEGPTAESYGLYVAALAGVPERVLRRAEEIMAAFSGDERKMPPERSSGEQWSRNIGDSRQEAKVLKELESLEADAMTPLEALNLIHRWKKALKKGDSHLFSKEPSLFD
ncbi:MAG: DNA mismatch repair protein MutS [Treponema sp.]|nr:DNA mismatch repair protein MutS [Treponema sp.]